MRRRGRRLLAASEAAVLGLEAAPADREPLARLRGGSGGDARVSQARRPGAGVGARTLPHTGGHGASPPRHGGRMRVFRNLSVRKPFDPDTLPQKIRAILGGGRA